jgi:folate-binding protein YgfZ
MIAPWYNGAENIEIAGQTVPRHYGDALAEYAAARNGAVVIARPHVGRLRALDRDRLDLLHRMSTNDLTQMAVGEARLTVLTTPIARIVDVLLVLNRGETALCLTGVGRATAVRRWLAGYIFYNDKVKYEDASATLGQLMLCGPRAAIVADTLRPGSAALAENRFSDEDDIIMLRGPAWAREGFTLIAPPEKLAVLWEQAVHAGAVPAGQEAYQLLRLAAGAPEAGHEITDEYIPLEANLWPAVSFSKGCYIGQEIIARMESRGKLARRLVGLKLDAPVTAGAEVRAGENVIGAITSAGVLPEVGPAALAYLKTNAAEPGTPITVADVVGRVVELPFV